MALASGTRLGPYEIVTPLGAGGRPVRPQRDFRDTRTVREDERGRPAGRPSRSSSTPDPWPLIHYTGSSAACCPASSAFRFRSSSALETSPGGHRDSALATTGVSGIISARHQTRRILRKFSW